MNDDRKIENLIYHYAELIDAGEFEALAHLFDRGEIVAPSHNATIRGFEAIHAMYSRSTKRYGNGTPNTRHITSNVIVELTPNNGATARSSYVVMQSTARLHLQPIIIGRYHDSFMQEKGDWHFTQRIIHIDLEGDLTHHLN